MKSTRIRRPRALSSVLAALGTLQPRALGLLIRVDFIDSLSNYYIEYLFVYNSSGTCIPLLTKAKASLCSPRRSLAERTLLVRAVVRLENISEE